MAKEKEADTLEVENQEKVEDKKADATATENDKHTETIPKERLDAALAESKTKDDMLKMLQDQLDLMRANMPQQQPLAAKQEQPDILEGIFAEGDTIVDRQQLEKALNRVISHVNNLAGQFTVQQQNPNFQEVIAEHLPEVLKADPTLFSHLQGLYKANPALAGATAYRLAKTSPSYLEKQNKAQAAQKDSESINKSIQELLKNRQTPQSISALGAGGGTGGSGSPLLDKVMELEKPEDFNKFFDELKSGATKLSKL